MQKRLVLCNLTEAFRQFKDKMPAVQIGFSKFADVRPKECILVGAGGTHSVCVCTIYQNVKLIFHGARLSSQPDSQFMSYQHCLAAIQCNPPKIRCHFGNCDECPGANGLQEKL